MEIRRCFDYKDLRNHTYNFVKINKGKKNFPELQNIITFDIETSNGYWDPVNDEVKGFDVEWAKTQEGDAFYKKTLPVSTLYVWQCAIEFTTEIVVYFGRTWSDWVEFLNELDVDLALATVNMLNSEMSDEDREMLYKSTKTFTTHIYIHNLGFEFQNMRNVFETQFIRGDVFARSQRSPMRIECKTKPSSKMKLQFNDTLCLTQKSLKNWAKDENLPVKKLEEPSDYYLKIRTPYTKLTENEMQYSENDVVVMIYGMEKYRSKYQTLDNIPMTQTGEVRRTCINKIGLVDVEWSKKCSEVTLSYTLEQFYDLLQCFLGGWTHANAKYTGKLLKNVRCFDFRSSYPAVMVTKKFPVGKWEDCSDEEREWVDKIPLNDRPYRYYVEVSLDEVYINQNNTMWSVSKCIELEDVQSDNGKIRYCSHMRTTMTDLDWDTFQKCYDFEKCEIIRCKKSEADYLPKSLIEVILDYYCYKTSLKGDDEKASLYAESKQFINSIYGVSVTKVVSDIVEFVNGEWSKREPNSEDFEKTIKKTAESKHKPMFLTYQIGVWVTAWARHNLSEAIIALDDRVAYGDTDSIKGPFTDEDLLWVNDYNDRVMKDIKKVCARYNIPIKRFCPKTKKGVAKEIGFFDREDDCLEFKTLGAKRYCASELNKDGEVEIHSTIAGLPKDAGPKIIKNVSDFSDNLKWDVGNSGKLTSYYIDDMPQNLTWIDEDGVIYVSDDKYGVNLMPTTFDLSLSYDYELLLEALSGHYGEDFPQYFSRVVITEEQKKTLKNRKKALTK